MLWTERKIKPSMKGIFIMWKKIINFFFRPVEEPAAVPVRPARYYQPKLPLE